MPFRPTLRFLYHYIWRQGFRDGYRGWILCRLLAWYELLIGAKLRELSATKRMPSDEAIAASGFSSR